jgi:hypothetical protein
VIFSNAALCRKITVFKHAFYKAESLIIGAGTGLSAGTGLAYDNVKTFNVLFPICHDHYGLQTINETDFYMMIISISVNEFMYAFKKIELPGSITNCIARRQLKTWSLILSKKLVPDLHHIGTNEIAFIPTNNRIRYVRYGNDSGLYFFVDKGVTTYTGMVRLSLQGNCSRYKALDNHLERITSVPLGKGQILWFIRNSGKT